MIRLPLSDKSPRRRFIRDLSTALLGMSFVGAMGCGNQQPASDGETTDSSNDNMEPLFFKISLAQWSLHRSFQQGKLDVRDFPAIARNQFGLSAVEYVNSFYADKAGNTAYLNDLKRRAEDHEVESLLIMVDEEGDLGNPNERERRQAVEQHYKWVDAAKILGCHSIRVNGFGEGSKEVVGAALTDGLQLLATYAKPLGINILIENHGLYSSDAQWVVDVIKGTGMDNCGTLPDFGNFCLARKWGSTQDGTCPEVYDRYRGVQEMLPFAKGVSAKSYAFDEGGAETTIDFRRMLQLVRQAGFSGYVGIEYEGEQLSETEGILATLRLLQRAGREVMQGE